MLNPPRPIPKELPMLTLWDLLEPIIRRRPRQGEVQPPPAPVPPPAPLSQPKQAAPRPIPVKPAAPTPAVSKTRAPRKSAGLSTASASTSDALARVSKPARPASAQARYDQIVEEMLGKYDVRVRKWRTSMSGIAWYVTYKDGRVSRLIEAPRPKGPMSVAVFLHEIGHHAIGFNVYKPRCREEYYAWAWAIARMEELGLNVTESVRHRMHLSLWYAVDKARRRGIKQVPEELAPYMERPRKRQAG